MLTHRLALALAVPLLLVAGCSDGDEDRSGRRAPGRRPRRADDEIDYPEEGVDLVDRPELEGVYERGLQTYVDFERGRRLAAREGRVGRLLSFNATSRRGRPLPRGLAAYADGRRTTATW